MARYRISLDEAPDEEYEIEVDDATEPDFGKLTDEVRRMRASQRAQETAKKALDKAVQPVTTMKTPIREMYKDKTEGAIAEGLAGPLTGAAGGALVGGVPGALIGGLAGTLPGLMGGSTSTAEALMNLVPTPKMPKLPGVLGKLFNYGDRAKPTKEVLDALPNATPYASALKTRLANAVKGGVAGGLEAKARDAAVQALETGEVKNNGKATTAGAILGGLSGLANVTPIKATLKQQGKARLGAIEEKAQDIAERQLSDKRNLERMREEATAAVRPNITNLKKEIPAREVAIKALEDTMSQRHATTKADRVALTQKETELANILAERAAQGKTRPTKQVTTLQTEVSDLKTKLSSTDAAEASDFAALKGQRSKLSSDREILNEYNSDPEKFKARVETMVDDYLYNTSSRGGSKKSKAASAAEIRDRINKGDLNLEELAGEARKIHKVLGDAGEQTSIGMVAGRVAEHLYQMFPTGVGRGLAGGLGVAIARGAKDQVDKINASLSRRMSSDKVRGLNKFIQSTVNQLNEANDRQIIKESQQEEEEPPAPSSRQALLEAIARQEGYYNEKESRAKRNKNPGNLRGKDGFYIYPSDEEGWAGLSDLLEKNKTKSLKDYIGGVHAPASPQEPTNDPAAYVRFVIEEMKKKGIDVNEDTLLEDLLAQ